MADTKISGLAQLSAEPAADDEFVVVDKSDTSMAASGTDKRMRYDAISGLFVPKSLVDAKGDLLAGTADNTVARVAVGSNGQRLVADSTATAGVAWKADDGIGLLAARPAANAVLPGVKFFATDVNGGTLFISDGSVWVKAGPRARVDYASITADVTLSTTLSDIPGLTVDVPAGDYPVELKLSVLAQKLTNVGDIFFYITDSANAVQKTIPSEDMAVSAYAAITDSVQVNPSGSARTFKARALLLTAGGRLQASALGGALGPGEFAADEC